MNKLTKALTTIIASTLINHGSLSAQAINNPVKESTAYDRIYGSFSKRLVPIDNSDEAYYFYLDTNNNPKFILEFLKGVEDTNFRRLNIYFTDKELGKSALKYRPELAVIYLNGKNGYGFGLTIKNDRLYSSKDPSFNDLYNYNLIPPEEVFRFFDDK